MENTSPLHRNIRIWRQAVLMAAACLPLAALGADFGDKQPSAADFIEQLQGTDSGSVRSGVNTRAFSLRPGAAAQATAAPAEAAQAKGAPAETSTADTMADPSVSVQISFDFGSDRVAGASRQTVENLAIALKSEALSGRTFLIVGHTDAVGSAAYNQLLSERRAQSVKSFLVERGVQAELLQTAGRGFTELLDADHPDAAANRRVEIVARRM